MLEDTQEVEITVTVTMLGPKRKLIGLATRQHMIERGDLEIERLLQENVPSMVMFATGECVESILRREEDA